MFSLLSIWKVNSVGKYAYEGKVVAICTLLWCCIIIFFEEEGRGVSFFVINSGQPSKYKTLIVPHG